MTLIHCTIAGNSSAGGDGGGGIRNHGQSFTLHNCIVAGNTSLGGPDISNGRSNFVSAGGNLIGNNTGLRWEPLASDRVGTSDAPLDPRLAPLGHYGGPTPTMPPQPGSPVLDAGETNSLTNDQRGFPRSIGTAPDIGAVEGSATK